MGHLFTINAAEKYKTDFSSERLGEVPVGYVRIRMRRLKYAKANSISLPMLLSDRKASRGVFIYKYIFRSWFAGANLRSAGRTV